MITFKALTKHFPKDTMWVDGCAEIVGYSYQKNLHIVIDDGLTHEVDNKYLVHIYQPKEKELHLQKWNSGEYPYKYLLDEPKIVEEWMDLS